MTLPRIFVLGDSISMQYGPYLERYVADKHHPAGKFHYARKSGQEEGLTNLAVPEDANGRDSFQVLSYLQARQQAGGLRADILLLNCGLHDLRTDPDTGAKQVSLDQYRRNLRQIIQITREIGPTPVWIRTTPCDENVHNKPGMSFHRFAADCETYNAAADEVMQGAGVKRIDLHTFTLNLGPDLYCDHVHFHEPIREKQAAYIAGWLAGWNRMEAL